MRRLLTIHGVGTVGGTGSWQESVLHVICPHFDCRKIRYPHFRWMGLIVAIIEPWALIPGLAMVTILWVLGITPLWPLITTVVIIALLTPRIRRGQALKHFAMELMPEPTSLKPNVIAHSMGTYMIGWALKDHPYASVNRLILAGCVLPADYPWKEISETKPGVFQSVRNEVGLKDPIPWMAFVASRCGILPGFGISGLKRV